MRIMSIAGDQTEYTWAESLKFFALGALWATLITMGPVAITLWDSLTHYNDPIDWVQIGRLTAAAAVPALFAYWQKHKALLKLPPALVIPPEFHPDIKHVQDYKRVTSQPGQEPITERGHVETHIEPVQKGDL